MAAIQQSILGALHTAQQGIAFTKHLKQQNELTLEKREKEAADIEKEIKSREQTVAGYQSQIAESESRISRAEQEAAAFPDDEEAAAYIHGEVGGITNPETGEVLVPSEYENIARTRSEIDRESEAIAKAQERLNRRYKQIRRLGGEV